MEDALFEIEPCSNMCALSLLIFRSPVPRRMEFIFLASNLPDYTLRVMCSLLGRGTSNEEAVATRVSRRESESALCESHLCFCMWILSMAFFLLQKKQIIMQGTRRPSKMKMMPLVPMPLLDVVSPC